MFDMFIYMCIYINMYMSGYMYAFMATDLFGCTYVLPGTPICFVSPPFS